MAGLGDYAPSYNYQDVFTGRKYSPDHPLPKIMQHPQRPKGLETMMRFSDLNPGPSTSARVEDHHVDLPRETHQRSQPGITSRRSRGESVEENNDLPVGNDRRLCPETMATVAMVVQRRRGKPYKPGSQRFLFDRASDDYEWLPSGWLCEERIMATGRVYRYYYGPDGHFYDTKYDALKAMLG